VCVVAEGRRHVWNIAGPGGGEWFSYVQRFKLSEDFLALVNKVSKPMKENGSVIGRQRRPTALAERLVCGPNGAVDIACVTGGNPREQFIVAWVAGLERLATERVNPFPSDEHFQWLA